MLLNGVLVTCGHDATTTHSTTDRNHTQGRAHRRHAENGLSCRGQSHTIILARAALLSPISCPTRLTPTGAMVLLRMLSGGYIWNSCFPPFSLFPFQTPCYTDVIGNCWELRNMADKNFSILAIFAHPDDEIGAASTFAHYSDQGVRVVLACATRGEVATIYCDDCATRETLAEVRTQELQCACVHMGIQELRWLDWPDGGIKDLPRSEVIRQVVELIRDVHPTIIVTHPENGLYPHPDHLAVWEIVRAAFDAAADEQQYRDAGPAWQAQRLYSRAMPQSMFDRAPGLQEFRVELNGELLPFMGTPDDEIDVVMHVGATVPRRMAAWACHRSQHNPKGFSSVMPDGLREEMAANEQFLLVAGAPLPPAVSDDLFAGLSEGDTYLIGVGDEAASGATEAAGPEDEEKQLSPAHVSLLMAELARHITLSEVLRSYQRDPQEAKQSGLYRQLAGTEQELIYRLARALRQLDANVGKTESDPATIREARRRNRPEPRREFLLNRMQVAYGRLQDNARSTRLSEEREVWEELAALARGSVELLKG
jgi:mycothiol S-conjugate amidase